MICQCQDTNCDCATCCYCDRLRLNDDQKWPECLSPNAPHNRRVPRQRDCPNCDMPLADDGGCYYPECDDPARPVVVEGDLDWVKIAKLAGKYGIRYSTNTRLVEFFAELGFIKATDEAKTIEILRRALAWHGDLQRMATTREEWQQTIDEAIAWVKANPEEGRPSFSSFVGLETIVDAADLLDFDEDQIAENDPEFLSAWRAMEAKGYMYSEGNVENVHLGWLMAKALTGTAHDATREVIFNALTQTSAEPTGGWQQEHVEAAPLARALWIADGYNPELWDKPYGGWIGHMYCEREKYIAKAHKLIAALTQISVEQPARPHQKG